MGCYHRYQRSSQYLSGLFSTDPLNVPMKDEQGLSWRNLNERNSSHARSTRTSLGSFLYSSTMERNSYLRQKGNIAGLRSSVNTAARGRERWEKNPSSGRKTELCAKLTTGASRGAENREGHCAETQGHGIYQDQALIRRTETILHHPHQAKKLVITRNRIQLQRGRRRTRADKETHSEVQKKWRT